MFTKNKKKKEKKIWLWLAVSEIKVLRKVFGPERGN
jgi:hypothetical protein